jgi:hypothetical protein
MTVPEKVNSPDQSRSKALGKKHQEDKLAEYMMQLKKKIFETGSMFP